MSNSHLEPFNPTPKRPEGKITWPVVSVRVHPDELVALDKHLKAIGSNRSEWARGLIVRALLAEVGAEAAA